LKFERNNDAPGTAHLFWVADRRPPKRRIFNGCPSKRAEIEKINLRLQTLLDSFLDGVIDRETYVAEKAKGMSQKKSLEEQSTALLKGRADWLEPCPRLQKSPWFLR